MIASSSGVQPLETLVVKPCAGGFELSLPLSAAYVGVLHDLNRKSPRSQMLYALEPYVPMGIDRVHAVFLPLRCKEALIAIAIDREQIETLIDRLEGGGQPIESITLASLPDACGDDVVREIDLRRIEFRSGPLQSRRRRRRLTWVKAVTITGILTVGLAITVGQLRRANDAHAAASEARSATAALADSVLGYSPNPIDPLQRLRSEHTRLSLVRPSISAEAENAASVLLLLLDAWPSDLAIETDQLRIVGGDSIEIRARVRDLADHEKLARELDGFAESWSVISTSGVPERDAVRSVLVLKRTVLD